MQLKLSSYLDRYVCISRNFSCFPIWIVTLSRAILAVLFRSLRLYLAQFYLSYFIRYVYIAQFYLFFLFGLLCLYLGQLQLSSYLDCYVCISGNYSCPLVWIVTFVSRATQAVFLFGLLRLYLAHFKLFSYLDCYVCILHNLSCFLIWIVTFVSCTI